MFLDLNHRCPSLKTYFGSPEIKKKILGHVIVSLEQKLNKGNKDVDFAVIKEYFASVVNLEEKVTSFRKFLFLVKNSSLEWRNPQKNVGRNRRCPLLFLNFYNLLMSLRKFNLEKTILELLNIPFLHFHWSSARTRG